VGFCPQTSLTIVIIEIVIVIIILISNTRPSSWVGYNTVKSVENLTIQIISDIDRSSSEVIGILITSILLNCNLSRIFSTNAIRIGI